MKSKKDRIVYGAAGGCGVSSGLGFVAVAFANRHDIGVLVAAGGAGMAVASIGVACVQWAVTK